MRRPLGVLGLMALSARVGLADSRIEVVPLARAPVEASATLPWVEPTDHAWLAARPLFDLASPKTRFSAKGWMAITQADILVRVEVRDPRHRAPVDDAQLWTGDGIEVALDARGDATGTFPRQTTGVLGPDDAKMMFALAPGGPAGFCFDAEPEKKNGPLPKGSVEITRDEGRGLTVYSLRLPWARFDTAAGTFPRLGVGIQVNDRNPGSDEREILTFGGGVFGAIQTGEMAHLAIGPPPATRRGSRSRRPSPGTARTRAASWSRSARRSRTSSSSTWGAPRSRRRSPRPRACSASGSSWRRPSTPASKSRSASPCDLGASPRGRSRRRA